MVRTQGVPGPDGKIVMLEAQDFISVTEPWAVFWIERLKIKVSVKLVGVDIFAKEGVVNQAGAPLVHLGSQVILKTEKVDEGPTVIIP